MRCNSETSADLSRQRTARRLQHQVKEGMFDMHTITGRVSDRELRETVLRHLEWEPEIGSQDINVKTDKVRAMTRTDPEIARDVVEAMALDMRVPDDRIKAGIREGWITLEGTVEWNYQREAADGCVKRLYGVRGVTNKIEVKPRVSTAEVKAKIEDALRRSAGVGAQGNVHSWLEKEEAARAAWEAPGVSVVVDHMAVCSIRELQAEACSTSAAPDSASLRNSFETKILFVL
jgi:osmotically-inducible protein OsmY